MSINIKSEEAEYLARRLAAVTGESLTGAITVAVRERLERVEHQDQAEVTERSARLCKIGEDAAGRWIEEYQSTEHSYLLYDESGLPR